MAKKPKKTRKELLKEPDEFITLSGKIINWTVAHKTQLTYALSIILALAVVFSGLRFFSNRAENKASSLLGQSLTKYEALKADKQPAEIYQEVSDDFQLILTKYGNQENGKLAGLIYANICYNAGKYQQAIELYKTVLGDFEKHPMIKTEILSGLGYAYEQMEDYSAAIGFFEQITSAAEPIMRDDALYHLGWLYDKIGQKEKSTAAFQKILSDHPDFIYIDLVKERLSG